MNDITYKCKLCDWTTSITAAWSDVIPRFCGNAKCLMSIKRSKGKLSFKTNPENLEVVLPKKPEKVKKVVETPVVTLVEEKPKSKKRNK